MINVKHDVMDRGVAVGGGSKCLAMTERDRPVARGVCAAMTIEDRVGDDGEEEGCRCLGGGPTTSWVVSHDGEEISMKLLVLMEDAVRRIILETRDVCNTSSEHGIVVDSPQFVSNSGIAEDCC